MFLIGLLGFLGFLGFLAFIVALLLLISPWLWPVGQIPVPAPVAG